jgi:hypothetical protein
MNGKVMALGAVLVGAAFLLLQGGWACGVALLGGLLLLGGAFSKGG